MAKAYRFFVPSGYFAGEVEDHGLQPSNSTYEVPKHIKGFVPRWTGKEWEQVEDHKGKTGYLNGKFHTIKEYGALPDGWSDEAPEPEPPTLFEQRQSIQSKYECELDRLRKARVSAAVFENNEAIKEIDLEYRETLKEMKNEMDAIEV